MGWCSGTYIFDEIMMFILTVDASEEFKYQTIFNLAVALESMDWDCQSDSDYWDYPLVQKVFKDLHPDWFEEDNE